MDSAAKPVGGISPAQLRAIYGMARKADMDNDDVHALAQSLTGRDSLKELNSWDAGRLILELKRRLGQPEAPTYARRPPAPLAAQPIDRASDKQQRMIYALARDMGWTGDPKRLRGWLEKRYKVSDARFLDPGQAGACIDAMKAMQRGGRAERKRDSDK